MSGSSLQGDGAGLVQRWDSEPGIGESHAALGILPLWASVYSSLTPGVRDFCSWPWWRVILRRWQPCFYAAHVKNPMNDLWLNPLLLRTPPLNLSSDICPFSYGFYWELTPWITSCKPREKRYKCSTQFSSPRRNSFFLHLLRGKKKKVVLTTNHN